MEGWAVREVRWRQPVVAVSNWSGIGLVILIADQVRESVALLDALRHSGYDGPFVLLATQLTPTVRKRAFLQGALDVMQLPADPHTLTVRVTTVLRNRQSVASPPAPDMF